MLRWVSPVSVCDLIKRCTKTLQGYEDRLHMIRRFEAIKMSAEELKKLSDDADKLSADELKELAGRWPLLVSQS